MPRKKTAAQLNREIAEALVGGSLRTDLHRVTLGPQARNIGEQSRAVTPARAKEPKRLPIPLPFERKPQIPSRWSDWYRKERVPIDRMIATQHHVTAKGLRQYRLTSPKIAPMTVGSTSLTGTIASWQLSNAANKASWPASSTSEIPTIRANRRGELGAEALPRITEREGPTGSLGEALPRVAEGEGYAEGRGEALPRITGGEGHAEGRAEALVRLVEGEGRAEALPCIAEGEGRAEGRAETLPRFAEGEGHTEASARFAEGEDHTERRAEALLRLAEGKGHAEALPRSAEGVSDLARRRSLVRLTLFHGSLTLKPLVGEGSGVKAAGRGSGLPTARRPVLLTTICGGAAPRSPKDYAHDALS